MMPTKGVRKTKGIITRTFKVDTQAKAQQAADAVTIMIANKAMEYTPLDTSILQGSQDREVIRRGQRMLGIVGYYNVPYAAAIHNRLDWQPRPSNHPGKIAGGQNMNAKPRFLLSAAAELRQEIDKVVKLILGVKK